MERPLCRSADLYPVSCIKVRDAHENSVEINSISERPPPKPLMKGCAFVDEKGEESWPRESGQVDKWIFCLTTATLAEDQEIR
jgi:hypothetical protein